MANFFAQISTIFHNARLTSYGRKSLLKILLAGVLLWGAVYLFVLANQIPHNNIALWIATENLEHVNLDMTIALGNHSNKSYLRDPLMNYTIINSGIFGKEWSLTANARDNRHRWHEYTSMIKRLYSQTIQNIDSVNAEIYMYYTFESNSSLPHVTRKMQERFIRNSNLLDTNVLVNDSLSYYGIDMREIDDYRCYKGEERFFFKDSIDLIGQLQLYSYSNYSRFNVNHPLYGSVNRELKDISRSYTLVSLGGTSRQFEPYSDIHWETQMPDSFKLTIDFGTPISIAGVDPEPDFIGLTYVVYTDPEKLKQFMQTRDILFFVKYLENENRQSMRLFWLTTVITALATWIVTVAWKWIEYGTRRRRFAKRRLQQG